MSDSNIKTVVKMTKTKLWRILLPRIQQTNAHTDTHITPHKTSQKHAKVPQHNCESKQRNEQKIKTPLTTRAKFH